jgi:hypothetical protein
MLRVDGGVPRCRVRCGDGGICLRRRWERRGASKLLKQKRTDEKPIQREKGNGKNKRFCSAARGKPRPYESEKRRRPIPRLCGIYPPDRGLRFGGEDYDRFVCAGDDGFGDGDQALLRAEDAEAQRFPFAAIEFGSGALGRICAAGLDVSDLNIKFCAVAHGTLNDRKHGDFGKFGKKTFEWNYPVGDAAFA